MDGERIIYSIKIAIWSCDYRIKVTVYIYIYIYIYNSLFDHAKFFLFIFHILAISISRSLYLLGFSNSIAEILLSDSTLISIN